MAAIEVLIGLLLFAAVGHGLWLVLGAGLRILRGLMSPADRAQRSSGVDEVRRLVERLWRERRIDPATHARLTRALAETLPADAVVAEDRADRHLSPPPPAVQAVSQVALAQHDDRSIVNTPSGRGENREAQVDLPLDDGPAGPIAQVPAAAPSRRSFAELLTAFMLARNIQWGELIGGALIVSCSAALVFSLWSTIAGNALLKMLTMSAVAVGVFGAGLFITRRWRLPTTGHGMLIIATLLVPITLLGMSGLLDDAALDRRVATGGALAVAVVLGSCLRAASRVIAPRWPGWLAVGTLLLAAWPLLGRRLVDGSASSAALVGAVLPPALLYVVLAGLILRRARRFQHLGRHRARDIVLTPALWTFAVLLAIAPLLWRTGDWPLALHRIAPVIGLLGLPPLAIGLILWSRASAPGVVGWRVVGTLIAAGGAAMLLLAVGLAWPDPLPMLIGALGSGVLLTTIALILRLPQGHYFAGAALLLAALVAIPLMRGELPYRDASPARWSEVVPSAATGMGLLLMVAAWGAAALLLQRRGRGADARCVAHVGAGTAVVSLLLMTGFGLLRASAPAGLSVAYAVYAATALVLAMRRRRSSLAWLAAVLLGCALVHGVVREWAPTGRAVVDGQWALVVLGALLIGAGGLARRCEPVRIAMHRSAAVGAMAAAALLLLTVVLPGSWSLAARAGSVALVWLAVSLARGSAAAFAGFQALAALVLLLAATASLRERAWFLAILQPLLHPWALQCMGIAVVAPGLLWAALRRESSRLRELLHPPFPAVDRILTLLVAIAFLGVSWVMVLPGIARQLQRLAIQTEGAAWIDAHADIGSVVLLLLLVVLAVAELRERVAMRAWWLLLVMPLIGSLLIAARGFVDASTASLLAWTLAGVLLALGVAAAVRRRSLDSHALANWTRRNLVFWYHLPLLLLIAALTTRMLHGQPIAPLGGALAALPPTVLHGGPLLLASLGLGALAFGGRSPALATLASLTLNATATVVLLFRAVERGVAPERIDGIAILQWNGVIAGVAALVWLHARRRLADRVSEPLPLLLWLQIGFAAVLALAVALPALRLLLVDPAACPAWLLRGGDPIGLLAVGLVVVTLDRAMHQAGRRFDLAGCTAVLMAAATVVALHTAAYRPHPFGPFHHLSIALSAVPALLLAIGARAPAGGWLSRRVRVVDPAALSRTILVVSLAVGLFALRGLVPDPARPWFTIAALTIQGAVLIGTAAVTRCGSPLWLSAAALVTAMLAWWRFGESPWVPRWFGRDGFEALPLALVAILPPALVACLLERMARRRGTDASFAATFQAAAALLCITATVGLVAAALFADLHHGPVLLGPRFHAIALVATAILVLVRLWSPLAGAAWPMVWWFGGALIGGVLHAAELEPQSLRMSLAAAAGAYALGCAAIWGWRAALRPLAQALHLAVAAWDRSADWLAPGLIGSALFSAWMAMAMQIDPALPAAGGVGPLWLAALAVLAHAISIGVLAHRERRVGWMRSALWIAFGGVLLTASAPLAVADRLDLLDLLAALLTAVFVGSVLYGVVAPRWMARGATAEWAREASAAARGSLGLFAAAVALLVVTEALAIARAPIVVAHQPAAAMIGVTLALAVIVGVVLAVAPTRIAGAERTRMRLVYGAEVLLGALLLHLRFAAPWLFGARFARYWPIAIIALAFVGTGIAEVLRRRGHRVLAEPLARTGVFLPVMPLVGMWVIDSQVSFPVLLLSIAALYGLLAAARRSLAFGVLSGLAANAALWMHLRLHEGLGLLEHPQLWIAPGAVALLIAAEANRDRLTRDQQARLRYLALALVYASATADVLLAGAQQSPWLPLLLAVESIAGILIGIALHLLSFLLLGAAFLLVACVSLVWQASSSYGWTWLWYVAGIALGLGIMAVFGLLEKKREETLRVLGELRGWRH